MQLLDGFVVVVARDQRVHCVLHVVPYVLCLAYEQLALLLLHNVLLLPVVLQDQVEHVLRELFHVVVDVLLERVQTVRQEVVTRLYVLIVMYLH